jgi:hypothetical protein
MKIAFIEMFVVPTEQETNYICGQLEGLKSINLITMNMKRHQLLSVVFFLLASLLFSCTAEEEQMEYAQIYFPLSTRATNGVFVANFDFTKDTTFIVGAYCAGSVLPPQDISVQIALAGDLLTEAQVTNPALASYELLPASAYEISPEDIAVVIKKGTERGDLSIIFHTATLDDSKQYILPLKITSTSLYEVSATYGTLFFGIKKR